MDHPRDTILTPEQARALFAFLEGPEGCDFQMSNPHNPSTTTWKCNGTLKMTGAWLSRHGLPVERVLTWLEQGGGYCDCEVLFNVAIHFEEGEEDEYESFDS